MQVLSLDVGGTAIKYAICDEQANLSYSGEVPTPKEKDSLEEFLQAIKGIVDSFKERNIPFDGIAMAMPGCVVNHSFLRTGGAIIYNYGQPMADLVEKVTGYSPVISNDAKAAAAAELWIGALQGIEVGAVLTLGTGLGGGFIINGKVFDGPNGSAGEISNLVYDCNKFSDPHAIEAHRVSTTGICIKASKALGLEYKYTSSVADHIIPINGRQIFEMYNEGNETIKKVIEEFGFEVGQLIFNLSVVLNLQKVAIGGGISAQPALIEAIREGAKRAWIEGPTASFQSQLISMPEIEACQFQNGANLIGAMYQYMEVKGLLKK